MLAALPDALAGLGRRMRRITDLHDSHRDAQLALQRLTFAPGERLLSFEDFELGLLLISEAPPERIQPKVDAWTAPLRANPMFPGGSDDEAAGNAIGCLQERQEKT